MAELNRKNNDRNNYCPVKPGAVTDKFTVSFSAYKDRAAIQRGNDEVAHCFVSTSNIRKIIIIITAEIGPCEDKERHVDESYTVRRI
jgi:hypothetical protein